MLPPDYQAALAGGTGKGAPRITGATITALLHKTSRAAVDLPT
jgi:hypothetical protein